MDIKALLRKISEWFLKFINVYIVYSSVIAVILFPMLFLSGALGFFLYCYRISWIFADPFTIIVEKRVYSSWLNTYLHERPFIYTKGFHNIKILIFLVGLLLFLISLTQLVYGIIKHEGIVRGGIYKFIRHPQNLSIIIMAFPFFVLQGIRIGDLVSCVQFIFLIIIYSDLGDLRLKKKFPDEFQNYYEQTGFMFPKVLPYKLTRHFSVLENKNKLLRYFIMLGAYILIMRIFYFLYIVFPFYHLAI